MNPTIEPLTLFYALFALTALGIVASIATGKLGRRKAHLACVIAMTTFLLATIWQALELAKLYDFPPDRYAIHRPIARLAFLSLLGPWVTGPLYWKGKVGRRAHLAGVFFFLLCAAAAVGTGVWMLAGAAPKPG